MDKKAKQVKWILYIGMFMLILQLLPVRMSYAADAEPVRVQAVEYYEEQLQVYNNNNTKIYFATEQDASKGNWEIIDAEDDGVTMIDISWLSASSENILVIRGDKNTTQSRVIIGKRPTKLSVTIDYTNMKQMNKDATIAAMVNIMSDVGTGEKPVKFSDLEWRKGTAGQWKDTDELTVGLLEKFLVNGTTLYFRIKAVDDVHVNGSSTYPDGTKGRRCSAEIKVKVPKQAAAANHNVDGGKFTVDVKYGKEYRISVDDGAFSAWVQVTDKSAKSLSLSDMLKDVKYNTGTNIGLVEGNPFPKMTIEVRDYASTKAPASKIASITLDKQRVLEQSKVKVNETVANDDNIYISYSGNKYLLIRIPSASSDNPYEYCVFKKGESFNLAKASWTAITKGTEIKVPSSKAVDGGILYVRKKEIKQKIDSKKTSVTLASTYVTYEITYPTIPVIEKASYTFIKDYSGDITFEIDLGKAPYETEVKNIKLGTRDIEFESKPITSGSTTKLEIKLLKDSLATLSNCTNKYIYIYFGKGTVDKSSVKLTIQNATKAGDLTVSTAKGTNPGTLSFTMVSSKGTNNTWGYIISNEQPDKVYTQHTVKDLTSLTPTVFTATKVDNVSATVGQYLIIFEYDKTEHIIKYKSIKITSDMIN